MKQEETLVQVTAKFKQDPNRPRSKWWDDFVGEEFLCYEGCKGWWNLSICGLEKLSKLSNKSVHSAILHKDCGKIVNKNN